MFVRHYICRFNGTQAALQAGFGSTPRSASVYAVRLLAKANIRAAVDAAIEARMKRLELTADNVLREIARVAFGDVRRLLDEYGEPLPLCELDDDAAAMVASIDVIRRRSPKAHDQVTRVKLWDKVRALELACRHLGIGRDAGLPPPYAGPYFIFPEGSRPAVI